MRGSLFLQESEHKLVCDRGSSWGKTMKFQRMTGEQRKQWDRDGYLLIPEALSSSELQELCSQVDRLDRESQRNGRDPAASLDVNNLIDAAVEGLFAPEQGNTGKILDPHPNQTFLNLIDHPSHLGMLCELMGAAIHLAWSHLMVRPPAPTPFNRWHQDGPKPYSFPRVEGLLPFQWVRVGWFLTDVDRPDRANLCVMPGSHRTDFPKISKGLDYCLTTTSPGRFRQIERIDEGVPGARQIMLKAGDAILLHNALYHCVVRNTSDIWRKNIYYVYTPIWQRLADQEASSPELIAQCDPVRKQLLGALSGPNTNGGIHPFDKGVPLVRLFEGKGFDQMWADWEEQYVRGTQA